MTLPPFENTDDEKSLTSEQELQSCLSRWAAIEPRRCRRQDDASFEVQYLGHWMVVTPQPPSHGTIIAAVLGGCEDNRIHCAIGYEPRYKNEPATIEVGCIPKMFSFNRGDEVIASIPVLLLDKYLEQLVHH